MPRLTPQQRANAIGRLQVGQTQADVARFFNITQSTISRLWSRFQATNSANDRPRSGRPRVTTRAQDRYIRLRHLRNRFLPVTSAAQALPGQRRVSDQTVRNRLREAGLRARRPVQGNVLNQFHRQQRLRLRYSILAFTNCAVQPRMNE